MTDTTKPVRPRAARKNAGAPATEVKEPKNPRNAAYTAAEKRLREAHPDEFTTYHREETVARGLVFVADERKEKAQAAEEARKAKAKALLEKLRSENPDLFEGSDEEVAVSPDTVEVGE
jgi:transketolase